MADAIKDYQGASQCIGIDSLDDYMDGSWIAQVKEDGMFVKSKLMVDRCEHQSRWGLAIDKGSIEDGLSSVVTNVNAILVGELEASSEVATENSRARGYRKIWYYDILELDGNDLRSLSLLERFKILEKVVSSFPDAAKKRLEIVEMTTNASQFKKLYKKAIEGIMLKKKDSKYFSTRKSRKVDTWVKMKKMVSQSMVLHSYTRTKIGNELTGRWALYNGKELVQVLTSLFPGLTEENQDSFLGRVADLKGFAVTKKGSLRSGQFEKWRPQLDREACIFNQEVKPK